MSASGEPSPSNMGRCDLCGKTIDLEHEDDKLVIQEFDDLAIPEEGVSHQEALAGVLRALDASSNVYDDMAAEAIREDGGYKAHERCSDKMSLVYEEVEE